MAMLNNQRVIYKTLDYFFFKYMEPIFCQDQFDRIDTNHDGVLSRAEWNEAMQASRWGIAIEPLNILKYIL